MAQVFKQTTNPVVAFSFVGLIIVSQLLVLNMGYNVPTYFLAILALLCAIILWGMLDVKCIIEGTRLKSKVGPFVQILDILKIEKASIHKKRNVGSRKRIENLDIYLESGKKLSLQPVDAKGFIDALKKINRNIKVEKKEY